jgi:hypothetical protein
MRSFRMLLAVLLALGLSTPAAAQFKKLKDAVTKKAEPKPATTAPQAAAPADGGMLVLTPELIDQLVAGLKAAKAERDKALKEDTPYGRYQTGKAAYAAAQPKCGAAQASWAQRAAADEKLMNRYSALMDKAIAAQQKGDVVGYEKGMYQAMALIDPACAVKNPEQPEDYYEAQRAVDERANQANVKATGLTDRELGLATDRVIAILNKSEPPGGASASEKSAVNARADELKSLYDIRDPQADRLAKETPAPAPTPAVAPADTQVRALPAGATAYNECMVKNVQAHEKEIEALGQRGAAAQQAGNTALMIAIADTIQRIQMAGCEMRSK